MSNTTCGRCGSVINTLTISVGAPPWCPVCGADFRAAPKEVSVPSPASTGRASPAIEVRVPSADIVPLTVAAPTRVPARTTPPSSPARARRPTVPLPAGVPAEVAARGDPEQVYASDEEQYRRNRTLVRAVFGLLALLLLAVAGFHFYTLSRPLKGYDLPHDTTLGVGIGTAVLALLLAAAGVLLTGTGVGAAWWGPRTYLVYEDVLVELRADRHRVIPWAGAIKEYAAERQYRTAFGDDAGLDEMRAAEVGPSVLARSLGGPPYVYRITLLGERLLFYRMRWAVLADSPGPTPVLTAGMIG
jgi:hypothetical protein